jgi:ParB family chromosome partitioning protein
MSRKALGRGLDALFTQVSPLDHELIELDIDRIDASDAQPRNAFNEARLNELAQSIKHNGIIQPLVVRRLGERFQIIAGERRWRAAQKAGLHRVPCIVKDIPDDNVLELSLIENIQREELNPIEEANAYKKLLEQRNLTQQEVAQRVGKDRSSVANALRLLKLPSEVQKLLEQEKLSTGHARALIPIDSIEMQITIARQSVSKSLSVREVERMVKKLEAGSSDDSRKKSTLDKKDSNILAAEAKLSKRLGAPVKIKYANAGKGGLIEIRFSSDDDLSRLYDALIQHHGPAEV